VITIEVYDPEHPLVLEAGGKLIEILISMGEFYDAERFARVVYDGLTRPPLDPESFEVARAASHIAEASYNLLKINGIDSAGIDIEDAEMLARKAVCIFKNLDSPVHNTTHDTTYSFCTLVEIKFFKNDFGEETKSLLEDFLSDAIIYHGPDMRVTSMAYRCLGGFHYKIAYTLLCNHAKREHLKLSESHFKEDLRINMIYDGPNDSTILKIRANLAAVSMTIEEMGMMSTNVRAIYLRT
jgi:hypothetical protein